MNGNMNPYAVLNKNLTQLQEYYKNKENTLKQYNLAPEAFNRAIAQMQDEYDRAKFGITSIQSQLDDIKHGVARGQIDPMMGQQSMMKLVLPEETYQAMFPKQQEEKGATRIFSPQQYNAYVDEFAEYGKSTIINPRGWGKANRKQADPNLLKEMYFERRTAYNYDSMDADTKKSFDVAWNEGMARNPLTAKTWKQMTDKKTGDPEVIMSRTYDARLLDIARKKAMGQSISPMAKAFEKKKQTKKTWGWPTLTKPAYRIRQEETKYQVDNQPTSLELRQQNTKEAYELGKKLGYWE